MPILNRMSQYVHIDSNVNILHGEEARQRLAQENDRAYLTNGRGVTRVDHTRWKKAQQAEHTHWFHHSITADSDRNEGHFEGFNGYRALRGRQFENAIELGCGPFTNMRLIADVCRVKQTTLLDPLIARYLSHPHCGYDQNALRLQYSAWLHVPQFLRKPIDSFRWWRRYPNWHRRLTSGHTLPIKRMIDSAIEAMPTDDRYDLVVIINVIEHCYDIEAVFERILTTTQVGGYLVFQDRLYTHDEVASKVDHHYDAAHPLRIDGDLLRYFLAANFEPQFERERTEAILQRDENGKYQQVGSEDVIYFIGRRKPRTVRFEPKQNA